MCKHYISQLLICLSASMTAFYRLSFPVLIVFDGLFTAFVCVCFVAKYLQDSLSMSFIMYLDNFIRVFLKLPYFLIYNQSYVCISLWLSVCLPPSVIFSKYILLLDLYTTWVKKGHYTEIIIHIQCNIFNLKSIFIKENNILHKNLQVYKEHHNTCT